TPQNCARRPCRSLPDSTQNCRLYFMRRTIDAFAQHSRRSKIPLRYPDDIARENGDRGGQRIFAQARLAGMLNKDSRFARPVSRPAGNRDGAQDVEPARIGICSGFLDLAQDIKRPELEDRYGYFRISQILGPKLARELLLELDLRQSGGLYGAR